MAQPMNRETKRLLRKQGQLGEDDQPVARRRERPQPQTQGSGSGSGDRVGPFEFLGEVRGELRKVAWPSRAEVVNYSIIVLITVVLMGALVAALDFVFGEGILRLLDA